MTSLRKSAILASAAAAFACFAPSVAAQETSRIGNDQAGTKTLQRQAIASANSVQDAGGPLNEAGVSSASDGGLFRLPKVQIQADDGTATGVVATGFDLVGSRRSGEYSIVSRTRLDLKLSIPFEKDEGRDGFFDFKGIGGGESITLGINFLQTKANADVGKIVRQQVDKARNVCIFRTAESWSQTSWPNANSVVEATQLVDAYTREYRNYPPGLGTVILDKQMVAWAEARGKVAEDLHKAINQACRSSDTKLIATYLNEDLAQAYKEAFFGVEKRLIWSLGAETTATFSDANFLDRAAFAIVEENKTEWQVSAYFGATSVDGNTSFKIVGSYASTLDFPDDTEVTRPNTDGTQDRLTGPDGPPVLEEDAFVSATVRHRFSKDGAVKNFAIAPIATYNIDENDWFFELPIYFQTNETGALDAGVRLGFDTGDDDFGAGVFVGVPF
jgi:hypothetical protein